LLNRQGEAWGWRAVSGNPSGAWDGDASEDVFSVSDP
jgi:hypothetical protein